jgi:F-type H+-transporting ATPase subunit alpha
LENGKLITAVPLGQQAVESIKNRFEKIIGTDVNLTVEVDPSLLGGFIVNIKNQVFDRSVKNHLNKFGNYIKTGEMPLEPEEDLHIDLEIDTAGLTEAAKGRILDFSAKIRTDKEGTVTFSGDGIVHVEGLEGCKYGELLEFENEASGIVMNLEADKIGAVLLNHQASVSQGSSVKNSGSVVRVPVGEAVVGRVINPLGIALDDKGAIMTNKFRNIEAEAPAIIQRQAVKQPLETGIMAIDSMIPIGKGQRELIIGDRQTGKTAIALDTILNQHGKNVYCIYVAIGQKASTISGIVHTLKESNALDYTTVIVSTASDAAPMQYIAPYAGCAIAEEFMYSGKDVIIIYDDLSKHAVAYRAMSLLLRRPPGREAYPGDVFYLHSRLLERAAKLSDDLGGGSITALPIIETMAGDISAYIPTNVISITDGQIYLEAELFNAGIRPAVNVGLSVSRVGGSAQTKAMRKVAGRLRLDLAQYRELAVFSQFAGDLDKATRDALEHGTRLTEMLKQEQYKPYKIVGQVVLLYAVVHKHMSDIPVKNIKAFSAGLLSYMEANYAEAMEGIQQTGLLSDENAEKIVEAIGQYKPIYLKSIQAIAKESAGVHE